MWTDVVLEQMRMRGNTHVINDSKTPSGRVHVGSLRGVIIHDALYRLGQQQGMDTHFLYGVDDFDPMDGLPHDATESLRAYMGQPLFAVPSPDAEHTDFADFYIQEFLDVCVELGVTAEIYRMRDVYQSGRFDEVILHILNRIDDIRRIYADFSKHKHDLSSWYPIQVICDKCGKIATTKAIDFDGKEITYRCEEQQVSWVRGCGFTGGKSPLSGAAKLPWKIEWFAKWHVFGVTLEGAGKDHCTKGGSRDVANKCFRALFDKEPPINVPYEFFLLQGAKMSSSKGVGFYAREMANFLPADVLRFLMVRQQAKKTVNFSVDAAYVVKLFNEYDQLIAQVANNKASASQHELFHVSATKRTSMLPLPSFQLIMTLAKMPHMNVERAVLDHHADHTDNAFITQVQERIASVDYWLEHFASADDIMTIHMHLPDSTEQLTVEQRAFLHYLAQVLQTTQIKPNTNKTADLYQRLLFDVARLVPIAPKEAFAALYCALFDKQEGPKGGSLIAYLGPQFVAQHLKNIPHSKLAFWRKTAVALDDIAEFLCAQKTEIIKVSARIIPQSIISDKTAVRLHLYIAQFSIFLTGEMIHVRRAFIGDPEEQERIDQITQRVRSFLSEIEARYQCVTDISVRETE